MLVMTERNGPQSIPGGSFLAPITYASDKGEGLSETSSAK